MKTNTKMLTILVLVLGLAVEVANADFVFGTPTNLGPSVNTGSRDARPSISADGLSLYFSSDRPGGFGGHDIWLTTRETKDDPWGTPVNLGPTVNSSANEKGPDISADGLELFFFRDGSGIWVTMRETKEEPWVEAVKIGPTVNGMSSQREASISADGLSLYFTSDRPGGYGDFDLWVTTRETKETPWGEALNLGPTVNSSAEGGSPSVSADGLMLFFSSLRWGGNGMADIWATRRATTDGDWGTPVNLGPLVNSSSHDGSPSISANGSTLFFWSSAGGFGHSDIWQAPIISIVDLNGDRIVNSADMCIMVDHWGTNESSCDIGPMPWGDGIVDVQDLIVLAEHLFEDYRLIAHWKMDEMEGDIAYDSVGVIDGILNGVPTWQPDGGKVDGALQFDGIDDYVETDFIINPADGSLSAFAWVKGGAPGQTIISQANSTSGLDSTWLCTDSSDGRLITKLMHPPFPPLESESVVTDSQWHHVGIVYDRDSVHRHLYVDGAEVARDMGPVAAIGSNGTMYFSADKTLDAGSFFSGLIDDVRIYNVALTAEEIAALAQ